MFKFWISCLVFTLLIQGCASSAARQDQPPPHDPDLARALVLTSIQHINDGSYDEARIALEQAIEADAFSGVAHNNLGLVYYHQDELYAAAQQFQLAAKLLPYNPKPINNLGLVLESAGRLTESVDQFEQALSLQPDNPEFIGNLARTKLRMGDKGERTRELIQELVAKDTRPDWREWASEKQALMNSQSDTADDPH